MKKMAQAIRPKVIISSYDDIHNPFYAGGGARSIREVASRLSDTYDITVITGNYPGAKNLTHCNVHYKRIGPSFLGPKSSQLLFHILLPFYAKTLPFDLWIESFTPPFSTSCLQLYTKKPVVGLIHMLAAEDMARKYRLPFDLVENRGLKTYRHFIALTEITLARISRLNPAATISLIPNGVTIRSSASKQSHAENYILYIGRLEFDQKGLDLLLDAYASIQAKTDAKLIIAGAGSQRDEQALNKKIQEYGLESRVMLIGRVEGKKKEKLLNNCHLVVVPSRLEAFSVVTLEAMSFGKPVVCFDIDGLRWAPATSVLKAKAFDARDLGDKIHSILANEPMRNSMSAAAQNSVQDYAWENVSKLYRRALNGVLEG